MRELDLGSCVTLAGFVPDAELPDYYSLCSAFAMPSKREGFGIVYLEAMACGKPAIAGDRDGARDALLDGEIGVLVDPDDVEAFAAAVVEVLSGEPSQPGHLRLRRASAARNRELRSRALPGAARAHPRRARRARENRERDRRSCTRSRASRMRKAGRPARSRACAAPCRRRAGVSRSSPGTPGSTPASPYALQEWPAGGAGCSLAPAPSRGS